MSASLRNAGSRRFVATLIASLALTVAADAQSYPDRPVKLVVAFPTGSGADLLVRLFGEKLAVVSGATVVVENRPGANGNIGHDYVAKSRPDGYTVLLGASTNMAGNPLIFKDVPWDAVRDFEPVTTLAQLGFVLTISAKSTAGTIAEFTQAMKAKGGRATFGYGNTTGLASSSLYAAEAGFQATSVSYKSGPQTVSDVVAGQVDFTFADFIFALSQEKQGGVRLLAVTTPKRSPTLPNVPTMAESGLPGATIAPWWAAFVPAKSPPEVIAKLAGWFDKIVEMSETREALLKQGVQTLPGSAALARQMLKETQADWARIIKIAKIEP